MPQPFTIYCNLHSPVITNQKKKKKFPLKCFNIVLKEKIKIELFFLLSFYANDFDCVQNISHSLFSNKVRETHGQSKIF